MPETEQEKPMEAQADQDVVVRLLSRWLEHHGKCACLVSAAGCDCGLHATLVELEANHE